MGHQCLGMFLGQSVLARLAILGNRTVETCLSQFGPSLGVDSAKRSIRQLCQQAGLVSCALCAPLCVSLGRSDRGRRADPLSTQGVAEVARESQGG